VLKVASVAAQTFLRTVAKVVGSEVIDDAIAFFQAFQGMEEGFRNRAAHVKALLSESATRFVLVASPRRDTLAEAVFFADAIAEADIEVSALIVNRMHPRFGEGLGEAARERAVTLAGTPLGDHYANLADFQLIAGREEDHLADLVGRVGDAAVVRVPFLRSDVHDLQGLEELAQHVVT
jgi:anion-transporting  ArsA/GET3 family ATPase